MNPLRDIARSAYYLIRGGGEPHILRKQEYHRRRALAEKRVLEEASSDPTLFRQNACPACGQAQPSAETFRSPVGFSFKTCPDDGTVYMDPVPTDATLSRLYNDDSYSFHWMGQKSREAVSVRPEGQLDFSQLCGTFTFPADRRPTLLDVGCATGGFLLTAQTRFDVEGVELNAETAEIARLHNLKVTTGTMADVPGDGHFDVMTMLQLIEHIVDPVDLMRQSWRLLRPGGIVYLNTPNIDSASFRLFRDRHMHVSSFAHVSLYSLSSLDRLARRCGFEVVAHAYCGGMDIALHDLVSHKLFKNNFRHRMALYRQRFFSASHLTDRLTGGQLTRLLAPRGNESYQWAVLRKPGSNGESAKAATP